MRLFRAEALSNHSSLPKGALPLVHTDVNKEVKLLVQSSLLILIVAADV